MFPFDRLPYGDRHDVRKRVEELFSRQMLGAVLVGKFVGDYAAILATGTLGTHIGYSLGTVVTIGLFIYWERAVQRAQAAKDEYTGTQTTIDSKWSDGPKN